MKAETINAQNDEKCITGIMNPANSKPLKVNALIFIFGIKMVSKYRRIAFKMNENNPRLITFKGIEIMLKTGLIIL